MKYTVILYVSAILVALDTKGQELPDKFEESRSIEEPKCGLDEINHSVLVECNPRACQNSNQDRGVIWPKDANEVLHIFSTRAGARFATNKIARLDFHQNEEERALDINTTIEVDTETETNAREVLGFGQFLDGGDILTKIQDGTYEKVYVPILTDLLNIKPNGLGYNLLVLSLQKYRVQIDGLADTVRQLEQLELNNHVKLVVDLREMTDLPAWIAKVDEVCSAITNRKLQCWSAILRGGDNSMVDLDSLERNGLIPSIVSDIEAVASEIESRQEFARMTTGLLVKSKPSVPYNVYGRLRHSRPYNSIITVSRDREMSGMIGDWQKAQHLGAEILNSLKHDSQGFLDDQNTLGDILEDQAMRNSAIYNLQKSHRIHFKGPIFYAIGHFSRYVMPGSIRLDLKKFTQPNMFAAQYIAFKTLDRHVVVVVLNDNEHLLPFRLDLNQKLTMAATLEPKSFNTFLIKLKA